MHHHRRLALVTGLTALALVLPAQAQTWRGAEAIGVQAADSKGKPIVGARVVFSFQGRGAEGNPPEVATDQKGRAVVAGLATGSWQAEVRHPDFLTYVAVFDLRRGKKPSINASFLEAGGRSLTPMRVKLSKGSPGDASPPLPTREASSQPVPPLEPDRATVEAAPTPPPAETARAPEATIAEEPLTPSPAESAPTIEEPALPEVQETRVPDPTPVPVLEPEQVELTVPPQPSPSTVEPSAPTTAEAEAQPEPAPDATTIAPEPERQPEALAEPIATGEEPAELESSLVAEAADEIPEVQAPPSSEPESLAPEAIEEEPAVELAQITQAPVEQEPAEAPPETTDQPIVPIEATEEAARQEPPAVASPATEKVEVDEPPAPKPEAPAAEKAPPPEAPVPAPIARTAIPDDSPTISSYRDGSCSECRTGEWAVTVTQAVATGSVSCPTETTQATREAADGLGNSMQLELSGFVGPAADGSSSEALASVEPAVSQAFQQQMAPYLRGASNCQMVSVVLPKTVRFAGFRYAAFDGTGGGECAPDRGCALPRAQWLANPVVQRGFNATVVWAIFESMAEDEPRFARLKVYFRPPSAQWKPPTQ